MPISLAIAAAVVGLSPVSITISTPKSCNSCKARTVEVFTLSVMVTTPMISFSMARSETVFPAACAVFTTVCISSDKGAPISSINRSLPKK